jgi:4-hydroxybenzoate polyprenyltransferase/phosphoserine phosphatase
LIDSQPSERELASIRRSNHESISGRDINDRDGPAGLAGSTPLWPLVIDLDGTLLKTNSLDETLLDALRASPAALWRLPLKLIVGRAAVKAFLARHSPLDVDEWPVRQDFLDFVRKHADAGHHVVLATGAHRSIADAIKTRFPFITEVIGTEGDNNLKGATKAQKLRERFPDGFIYAGDSAADLEIWRNGADCVLVGAARSVAQRASRFGAPRAIFPREDKWGFTVLRRSFRLHQWVKNGLLFVPLVLGGKAADPSAWGKAWIGFLALSAAASATYIINDLWDLPHDRKHWSKRTRPLAAGNLSIRSAVALAFAALLAAFALAIGIGTTAVGVLAGYILLTLSYSFGLKRIALLDIFALASLFTVRLGFGIALTDVRTSPWLLVFSMFAFLSLSAAKRHTEVLRLIERGLDKVPGRGYIAADAPMLLGIGMAASLGAVLIMILYLIEDAFPRQFYSNPAFLWAIPPVLFLFFGRIWLLCQRGRLHDDPVAFAMKDRASLALGAVMTAGFAAALLL